MAGALLVHVVVIALLILVGFTLPEQSEEGGVPVMMGETPDAWGAADPSLVEVETMPEEAAPEMPEEAEQEMLTQEDEETVAIKSKAEEKKKEVKKPEKSAAEKAEEARKLAAEKAERERKAAEEAARKGWREQFDLASARAVAALPMLAEYCLPLVKVGGNFLAMKGASGEDELAAARGAIKKLGGEYKETRTLHLPGGDTRTLILCKKISQTPTAYPRNGGKIAKSPLK